MVCLIVSLIRCERHLKIFGRETQEMKIAKYVGEKLIFAQQQNLVVFPRAVLTCLMMKQQQNKVNLGNQIYFKKQCCCYGFCFRKHTFH